MLNQERFLVNQKYCRFLLDNDNTSVVSFLLARFLRDRNSMSDLQLFDVKAACEYLKSTVKLAWSP